MKRLLKTEMTWVKVMILAVGSAVVIALLNCIPALERTSFTAPAETLEAWIVLAVYIIMNCKSYKDSMLKTFVFFLVSQPLIYLIEVPFKEAGWSLFGYYPFWGIVTVLTIPGAAIAYRVKKGDTLSALILSVANVGMIIIGFDRINTVIYEFPRFIITLIFCLAFPVIFIVLLLKEKKSRIIASSFAAAAVIAGILIFIIFPSDSTCSYYIEEGDWSVSYVSDDGLNVEVLGEESLEFSSHKNGNYNVTLTSSDGRVKNYSVSVSGGNNIIRINETNNVEDELSSAK